MTWEQFKWECEMKFMSAKDWVKRNKEIVIVVTPVLLKGVFSITKDISRKERINEEKDLKERWVYDRSAGHYYELRRKVKSQEWVIIDERRRNGESLGSILASMRLLK